MGARVTAASVVNIDTERVRRWMFDELVKATAEGVAPNLARFFGFVGAVDGETWMELQALKVPHGKWEITRFAHARDAKILTSLLEQAEKWQPPAPGIYVIANEINSAVTTREQSRDRWLEAKKGVSTTDRDIESRRVLFVDVDAERGTGTSSTDEEKARAREVAERVLARLLRDLPARSLGVGDSGNGYGLYVALDAIASNLASETVIKGILAALDVLFSNDGAKIDRSVCDAKRLVPAFGTTKRKGAPGIPERPHRRTAFVCGPTVTRVVLENLTMLFESLYGELDDAGRLEVDKATGKKPQAPAFTPVGADAGPYARAKAVDIHSVAHWLGLVDGDGALRCPGCGSTDAGVAFVQNGFKCSHDRCADKGYAKGFRTTVDLVAEVRAVDHKQAVDMLAEQFGFESFSRQRAAAPLDAASMSSTPEFRGDELPPDPDEPARSEEPANPLDRLRSGGALVGYRELCEATATPPVSIWVDGVLEDSHVEISGPSGHGKSTLSSLLLVARANPTTAVKVLGHTVQPAPRDRYIVSIQEENGLYSWRLKCEAACQALGLPVSQTLERVIFLVRRNVLAGDERWEAIRSAGGAGLIGGVFVDSRARVLRAGESNREEHQAQLAEHCFNLVGACRAPLFVVSHTRKGRDGSVADDTEDVSGSLQRAAGADVLVIVTAQKDDAGQVEHSTAKFAKLRNAITPNHPAPVTFRVWLDMDGRWRVDNSTGDIAAHDSRPASVRLLEILERTPEGLTKYAIKDRLKINHETMENVLTSLFRDRAIQKISAIVNGRPRDVITIRDLAMEQ
jgi:hypothetical protein